MGAFSTFGTTGLIIALASLVISGCAGSKPNNGSSGAIHVRSALDSSNVEHPDTAERVALRVDVYLDQRPAGLPRKIGDIHATVVDMHQAELLLDQDVSTVVTAAIGNTFAARGFKVSDSAEAMNRSGADAFQLNGRVKNFALDVGRRDQLAIAVETTVRDPSGRILWSGVVSEIADRYAGVGGNTKGTIAQYLTAGLKTVADKTFIQVNDAVRQARPDLFRQSMAAQTVPGVEVIVPALVSEPLKLSDRVGDATTTLGRLSITTTPTRAKVYLGDVYWGLSPLRLELAPDIYLLRVSLDGHKTVKEKVSVRKGVATELEIGLEK